jgi:ABC-type spermidine/putrescine transport system permease subunit II
MYLLVGGLLLAIGLSVWVGISFQQNRFDYVWPIVVLRWFSKIFFQMLDIMSVSLFLMALDCQTFARPLYAVGYNQEFPDICE